MTVFMPTNSWKTWSPTPASSPLLTVLVFHSFMKLMSTEPFSFISASTDSCSAWISESTSLSGYIFLRMALASSSLPWNQTYSRNHLKIFWTITSLELQAFVQIAMHNCCMDKFSETTMNHQLFAQTSSFFLTHKCHKIFNFFAQNYFPFHPWLPGFLSSKTFAYVLRL